MNVLATLPAGTPEHTLGWGIIPWAEARFEVPHGPNVGDPWKFTLEQGRFMLWWYAIDADGRFRYRRGVLQRSKGWGKDPLGAVLCITEMFGPVRFGGWGTDGEAIGVPVRPAWVSVGAVSEEQTRTTTSLWSTLIPRRTQQEFEMVISEKIVRGWVDGSKQEMRPVTQSFRSNEGARPTFFLMNETQHWTTGNGGRLMADVIRRNLAKDPTARALGLTNAYAPGEGSVAEEDHEGWKAQQEDGFAGAPDILYDSRELALPDGFDPKAAPDDVLTAALRAAYGDSHWVDVPRVVAECRDPRQSAADAMRFYLNALVAGAGKWMAPKTWDAAYDPAFRPKPGASIALGFDGSKTYDATALVGTDMVTGTQWILGLWERNWLMADWSVPVPEVLARVDWIFDTFEVARFYADPPFWEEQVAMWCGKWEKVASAWWTGGPNRLRVARALHAWRQAIVDRECRHGGDNHKTFRRHVLAATKYPFMGHQEIQPGEPEMYLIRKDHVTPRAAVDLAYAGLASWAAREDAIASGWKPKRRFRVAMTEADRTAVATLRAGRARVAQ